MLAMSVQCKQLRMCLYNIITAAAAVNDMYSVSFSAENSMPTFSGFSSDSFDCASSCAEVELCLWELDTVMHKCFHVTVCV